MSEYSIPDHDPVETQEWLDALDSILEYEGAARAQFILNCLNQRAEQANIQQQTALTTPYVNTVQLAEQPIYPGDLAVEHRLTNFIRWNAIAMVLRGGKYASELGGHIASYASAATLYEVGFNHFFHAPTAEHGGDLLYIQGHASPGIYARAYLEGRFTADQLDKFRQEIGGQGLSSYPHPWLMPNFWQFATVSMGLGPLQAIYQARFLKYLHHRGLADTAKRKVWMFCGDGEMDEPESLGAITCAGRENLNNLIFVINCNLQRLDGPVRGNSKIIQELESVFRGAGWKVIKVIWGSGWDRLLAKDHQGLLRKRMAEVVDGEYQNYAAKGPAYFREHFFGQSPELTAMIAEWSDDELAQLQRGGHDWEKVYAAYAMAVQQTQQPTVVLAKTIKGFGMGEAGEAQNITHQQKKMTTEQLQVFCKRFDIPLSAQQIEKLEFCAPVANSPEMQYLQQRRQQLGGFLPARRLQTSVPLTMPELDFFATFLKSTETREVSTTMVFVRILTHLLKDKTISDRIVPIVPDESRTFGMEGMFRQIGIYSHIGQLYKPVDSGQVMYYREDQKGQILEEGINEPGAFASWMAAATSYSTNNLPMIPFYIYYSMFGFQRIGDLAWAAGDMQARGFLIGGTAGRTTLAGEGLQHQDGHSHLFAATIPNCVAYDPAFGYELAVIIQDGLKRMIEKQENVFYYLTVMNENYSHPEMPVGAEQGILKGMYLLQAAEPNKKNKSNVQVQLLGSGAILREVLVAAKILQEKYAVNADVWSVTSFNELRKEALNVERDNFLHPERTPKISTVTQCLQEKNGPVVAATDYMRAYADQIRAFVPQRYVTLGTDGFGRSATRTQLRDFFEVDAKYIVVAALKALADDGKIPQKQVTAAIQALGIDSEKPNPVNQ